MILLAIDPGPTRSAWVELETSTLHIRGFSYETNEQLLARLRDFGTFLEHLAIERVQSYGRSVGNPVFETVFWTGRFVEAVDPVPFTRIASPTVRAHLCGRVGVGYPEIRSALYDRFGGAEGKAAAVGRKASPGPLYGLVGDDLYGALAVGVTFADGVR